VIIGLFKKKEDPSQSNSHTKTASRLSTQGPCYS